MIKEIEEEITIDKNLSSEEFFKKAVLVSFKVLFDKEKVIYQSDVEDYSKKSVNMALELTKEVFNTIKKRKKTFDKYNSYVQ